MATFLTLLRRIRRCEAGAELVEMALVFPLLLLVVLGIIDFGLMFQRYEVLTNAAREGARIAVLPDYQDSLQANVDARVMDYINASFFGGTAVVEPVTTQTVSLGAGLPCVTTATVTVSYPHQFFFVGGMMSYFGSNLGSRTFFARSTMRTEASAAGC